MVSGNANLAMSGTAADAVANLFKRLRLWCVVRGYDTWLSLQMWPERLVKESYLSVLSQLAIA
jgi:hypothetical protein